MKLFVVCVLYSIIPYLLADPSPSTIQIQNYDGPIFLHSPKPNCCPLCNSLLTQKPVDPDPCDEIPEEYLRTTPYETNDGTFPTTHPFGAVLSNAYTPITSGNKCGTGPEKGYGEVSGNTNSGTILHTHTNVVKAPGNTYSVPLTPNTLAPIGNTYSGTNAGNTYPRTTAVKGAPCENTYNTALGTSASPYCGTQPTITGTECSCTCVTRPLSSYLPINTSQNTCYKLPIVNNNNQVFVEEEPVLVPQKFSYSLVLDGDVAPFNQNRQCYYYC